MRIGLAFCLLFAAPALGQDAEVPPRYDVNAIPPNYPQTTPEETLASVLKALERDRIDYMAAHLLDPEFVDARLTATGITFAEFVGEVRRKFQEDPQGLKDLRRIMREGVVDTMGGEAIVTHAEIPDKKVFLKRINNRWFIENHQEEQPEE